MDTTLSAVINQVIQANNDRRTHYFDVQVNQSKNKITLSGTVLDEGTLSEAVTLIKNTKKEAVVDTSTVKILRSGSYCWCATNFTSMHAEPSWLAEQLTQCAYGIRFEVLKQENNWIFVRQDDGYLAWVYKPYCSLISPVQPTHLVAVPVQRLFDQPSRDSAERSRLFMGTSVTVDKIDGLWAYLTPNTEPTPNAMTGGWVIKNHLFPLSDFPTTKEAKRQAILAAASRLTGVPYLWGGTNSIGIDCSGLAQLSYRMAGLLIPRDADMQKAAGHLAQKPFNPGDLVFFGDEGDLERITHVGISLGGWEIIHSSRSRNGVYTDNIQQVPHLLETFAGGFSLL